MKKLIFVLLALSMPMFAQTTYNLPSTRCAITYAVGYGGNFDCSDVPVTINGTPYYVNFAAHINPDNTFVSNLSAVTFTNLANNQQTIEQVSGYFAPNSGTNVIGTAKGTLATGAFSLTFVHVPGRFGGMNYQENSTLTVD